jgi:hypothetical protein
MGPSTARDIESAKPKESFSQLIARILDQLSLSAWLPSAALIMATIFTVQIRRANGSAAKAFALITEFGPSEIVLAIAAVVVGTVVTQAFEFEAIRALEGYWGPGRALNVLASWRCRRHVAKHDALSQRRDKALIAAFGVADVTMRRKQIPGRLVDVVKGELFDLDTGATDEELNAAMKVPWRQYGDAAQLRVVESIDERLRSFPPAAYRVLPTKLGNTLRAYEDRAAGRSNESLEGWVLRRFHTLPTAVQYEHDQHRSRLDLYCSMVFVAITVGVVGLVLLWPYKWVTRASMAGVATATAWLSYRAAIGSARAYGTTLEAIATWEPEEGGR